MISFAHPFLLLLCIIVFLMPWLIRFLERTSSVYRLPVFSSTSLKITGMPPKKCRVMMRLPFLLIQGALLILIIAVANPLGKTQITKTIDKAYRISLAFDVSGSMSGEKLVSAKSAARALLEARKTDVFAVLPFEDTVRFADGVAFTTDHALVADTIQRMQVYGGTALGNGMLGALWSVLADKYSIEHLEEKGVSLPSFEEMLNILSKNSSQQVDTLVRSLEESFGSLEGAFIIAITDGMSNTGVPPEQVITFAGRLNVPFYIIGIDMSSALSFASVLGEYGGKYFNGGSQEILSFYREISKANPMITGEIVATEPISLRPYCALAIAALLVLAVPLLIIWKKID